MFPKLVYPEITFCFSGILQVYTSLEEVLLSTIQVFCIKIWYHEDHS